MSSTPQTPSPEPVEKPAGSLLVTGPKRWLYLILAYLSLGTGMVGIFVPGLPTTEFVLLAAWAAAKSSPRLSAWLENHRLFGPMLHNWRNGRVVTRSAKLAATFTMSLCLLLMLWFVPHRWLVVVAAIGMASGALWMWSRPEVVQEPRSRS